MSRSTTRSTRSTTLTLQVNPPFDFARTLYSHGWVELAPNVWEAEREAVRRVQRLESGRVVLLEVSEARGADGPTGRPRGEVEGKPGGPAGGKAQQAVSGKPAGGKVQHAASGGPDVEVRVRHAEPLVAVDRREVEAAVRRMLRLDEDFSAFYALCEERGGRWARVTEGLGRLLRSPTLFEDVVKTILTTNVQWGGTKRMARELVRVYGAPYPEEPDRRAFPTPEAIAAVAPETFGAAVNLGYRAPYVHELATRVASGDLDLEGLARTDLPTPELKERLLAIKGVGPYAAATLLMLVGRYDELAVDSVFRQFVAERYFDGESPGDAEARAIYDSWGRWKYLAYWFDLWTGLEGKKS